jgi:hypothetical protein
MDNIQNSIYSIQERISKLTNKLDNNYYNINDIDDFVLSYNFLENDISFVTFEMMETQVKNSTNEIETLILDFMIKLETLENSILVENINSSDIVLTFKDQLKDMINRSNSFPTIAFYNNIIKKIDDLSNNTVYQSDQDFLSLYVETAEANYIDPEQNVFLENTITNLENNLVRKNKFYVTQITYRELVEKEPDRKYTITYKELANKYLSFGPEHRIPYPPTFSSDYDDKEKYQVLVDNGVIKEDELIPLKLAIKLQNILKGDIYREGKTYIDAFQDVSNVLVKINSPFSVSMNNKINEKILNTVNRNLFFMLSNRDYIYEENIGGNIATTNSISFEKIVNEITKYIQDYIKYKNYQKGKNNSKLGTLEYSEIPEDSLTQIQTDDVLKNLITSSTTSAPATTSAPVTTST